MSTLSAQFTRGRKANQHQYHTYCNGCITKYKLDNPIDTSDMDDAEKFQALTQHTQDGILKGITLPTSTPVSDIVSNG
ncbi:hypothetical protein B0H10DRAFT_2234573 [Mycena sp. CBHHK59/15]|nr:hypothetical protein B0H10DRAFT_2234573 [Mycena sp. CBHHK59/15]